MLIHFPPNFFEKKDKENLNQFECKGVAWSNQKKQKITMV